MAFNYYHWVSLIVIIGLGQVFFFLRQPPPPPLHCICSVVSFHFSQVYLVSVLSCWDKYLSYWRRKALGSPTSMATLPLRKQRISELAFKPWRVDTKVHKQMRYMRRSTGKLRQCSIVQFPICQTHVDLTTDGNHYFGMCLWIYYKMSKDKVLRSNLWCESPSWGQTELLQVS